MSNHHLSCVGCPRQYSASIPCSNFSWSTTRPLPSYSFSNYETEVFVQLDLFHSPGQKHLFEVACAFLATWQKKSPDRSIGISFKSINSSWPSDTMKRCRSGSTLVQVMACYLWHQTITWINVDLLWLGFCSMHMRSISRKRLEIAINTTRLKIKLLGKLPHLPWVNTLSPMNR